MPKIDNITYPEGSVAMLKDRYIGPMYRAYLDSKYCPEIHMYLDEAGKKHDPKTQFKKFFAVGAPQSINILGDALTTARRLGAAKDWKNKAWDKVYDQADEYVKRIADGEHDSNFYKRDEAFKKHHVAMVEKQMLRQNYPALLAELETTDKKGIAAAAAMLKAGKKSDGPRTAKAIIKKNKLSMSPKEVIKKIKKAFKIK